MSGGGPDRTDADAGAGAGTGGGTGTPGDGAETTPGRTLVDAGTIEEIALGATVLGTGGGGDPHVGKLVARQAIEEHGPVELLDPADLDDDAFVVPTAQMGAPTVSVEKLPGGDEAVAALERVEAAVGREADATMPIECGGINSTFPFAVAARRGLPVVDADGMGRAFPELQHETFNVYGVDGTPAAVADERGDTCLLETGDNERLEWLARGITVRMGGVAYVSDYPMSGREVRETAIHGTMSLAREIGAAVRAADGDVTGAIREATAGSSYGAAETLFEGKIVDVERRTRRGFVVGHVDVAGLGPDEGRTMTVEFQNENLGARVRDAAGTGPGSGPDAAGTDAGSGPDAAGTDAGSGPDAAGTDADDDWEWIATVPDLLTVLDRETGDPIPTERLRYGARVRVLGIPTPEIMRTDAALDVWGPRTFGLDTDFVPVPGSDPGSDPGGERA
jgi:hypothetical protein